MQTTPSRTPEPPYYAVIFTSTRTPVAAGYEETARRMVELASQQPGFLGVDSARSESGLGLTVSYWRSEADIRAWKRQEEHLLAQQTGKSDWYSSYEVRIARVERAYGMPAKGDFSAG